MTDRGLPIVDGAPACPFVAFEDDRDSRGQEPDHRHRCYAEPRPAPRAAAHQAAYCLSSAFPVCPTFQDWARREAATARAAEQADDEPDAQPYEEPVASQPLPPLERPPRSAPGTDTPPPLAPRRNPPRDWAAPPPWTGDNGEGAPVDPPPFLAPVPPVAPVQPAASSTSRGGDADAYGAASRGLAGSAADRLAGSYGTRPVDDEDEGSYVPSSAAYAPQPAAYDRPAPIPPTAPERPPASSAGRQGRGKPSSGAPSGGSRPPQAQPKPAPQDPAELFGPAWERPRKYEAYPTLRTRVGLPAIGGPPRVVVAVLALVVAAGALFFVGPMLLGLGGNGGSGPAASATVAPADATPTPLPTAPPAPTPVVYIVAKGDTISKIARKNHVTVEALLAANPKIKDPNKIKVGDAITIPIPEPDSGSAAP